MEEIVTTKDISEYGIHMDKNLDPKAHDTRTHLDSQTCLKSNLSTTTTFVFSTLARKLKSIAIPRSIPPCVTSSKVRKRGNCRKRLFFFKRSLFFLCHLNLNKIIHNLHLSQILNLNSKIVGKIFNLASIIESVLVGNFAANLVECSEAIIDGGTRMDNDGRVLRFQLRGKDCDIKVDEDKCNLLDLVMEFEDISGINGGLIADLHYPTFAYLWKMQQWKLLTDVDLMTMFQRLRGARLIYIWVGTVLEPTPLNLMELLGEVHQSQEYNEDRRTYKTTILATLRKSPVVVSEMDQTTKGIYPPSPKSPNTVFQTLQRRTSPRFSPQVGHNINTAPEVQDTNPAVFARKMPRTTAIKKGFWTGEVRKSVRNPTNPTVSASGATRGESRRSGAKVRRKVTFEDEDDSDGDIIPDGDIPADELEDIVRVSKIKDNWKPSTWFGFIDEDDDDYYFQKLYINGEMYEDKEFGRIELRPWMIFTDKDHFKDTLKDYCIQEKFSINVLYADKKIYTVTCSQEKCDWRLHASRLPDGRTWAIKKIMPNEHTCRGLETHNPVCSVKWAASKVMEDIRANPDIPGLSLYELLFKRFGLFMKQTTLYRMKRYVIEILFGGHDKSYGHLPAYAEIIRDTNP
ncbi:uncharacterized protein [Spinacia oleracea]|uniref:Transposase MuDR plant domain-containing protein n=1 Tax=Spinacia oleracea TaxID=3562 RepID=A0ABM3QZ15_SPIOL|nr:uncharacterized protein LOC110795566 [Spinacia oleracea]